MQHRDSRSLRILADIGATQSASVTLKRQGTAISVCRVCTARAARRWCGQHFGLAVMAAATVVQEKTATMY